MRGHHRSGTLTSLLTIAILVLSLQQANGQLGDMLSTILGGNNASPTPVSTPAATTVSTTPVSTSTPAASDTPTPSTTPAAQQDPTPAATVSATPAATAAVAATDTDTDTPAAPVTTTAAATTTPATTRATPAAVTTSAASSLPSGTMSTGPRATPRATSAPPPPPVPIVIDPSKLVNALPADETQPLAQARSANQSTAGVEGLTAADIVLQVSGSGVTPFGIPQQSTLLRAMASVLTTVSLGDLRIRYVTSSANIAGRRLMAIDSPQSIAQQARRTLLQTDSGAAAAAKQGNLYNVATVTLEANCSSEQAVPATLTEMQSVMDKGLLASALQYYNATSWGATMLSLTSVDPTEALNLGSTCKQRLGTFCLDNSSLSVSAAEAIIGIGCFVVIMLICIPCVFLEWRRRSGRMAELEPTPETPKSPMQKVQNMYNNLISTVKQVSPMHRKNSRTAFRETPRGNSESPRVKSSGKQTVNINASSTS